MATIKLNGCLTLMVHSITIADGGFMVRASGNSLRHKHMVKMSGVVPAVIYDNQGTPVFAWLCNIGEQMSWFRLGDNVNLYQKIEITSVETGVSELA